MPIYTVRALETSGNPVDGYEIIGDRVLGQIYVPPARPPDDDLEQRARDQWWHEQLITQELARAGFGVEWGMNAGFHLFFETYGHETTVLLPESAFAARRGHDERFLLLVRVPENDRVPPGNARGRRYLENATWEATAKLQPGEALTQVDANRPILSLMPQAIISPVVDPFWVKEFIPQGSYTLVVELRYFDMRLNIEVYSKRLRHVRNPAHNDFFEWPLDQWLAAPTLGFDPVNGEPLPALTKDQFEMILILIDAEMEKR